MKYVYKIVAFVIAFAIIPIMIFTPFITVRMQSTATMILAYISEMKGNTDGFKDPDTLPEYIGESFAISDLFMSEEASFASGLAQTIKNYGKGEMDTSAFESLVAPAIALLISMVLTVLMALATAITALVTKDNRKVIYCSIMGIGSAYMIDRCFGAVAQPFLDQKISIASLTEAWWGSFVGEVTQLELTYIVWYIMAAFAGIIIWTVCYNYTLPADEKKARLRMIGEAKDE